jgi:predicted Zn-dependent peptidase
MLKSKTLKNGMRYHLVPFSGTQAATVLVLSKIGSRNESDAVWGGSHYIEHLMFKGTKRRPNTIDISKTLDRYGAQYNAYTGKDLTGYYVKIDGEKVDVAIDLLNDMLFHSKFDEEEMNREKGVIIEEIKMYEENPIMHLEDLLEEAMFDGHVLGRNIAGTAKSMTDMKREDVIAYRDKFYLPSEMVVVVAGNVPKNAEELLEETFGSAKDGEEPPSIMPFGDTPERKTPRIARQEKELEQIQIGIGFPTVKRGHEDMPAINLLANILGGGMSSRLFIEVREKRGLCYSVRASAEAYEDVGMFQVRAGLDAGRLELAAKTIYEELEKIRDKGVTDDELARAKDNVEGSLKLAFENSSNQAEFVARQELFLKEVKTLDEKIESYKKVTQEDVQRVAQEIINFKKISIAAIGPYGSDEALLEHFPVVT